MPNLRVNADLISGGPGILKKYYGQQKPWNCPIISRKCSCSTENTLSSHKSYTSLPPKGDSSVNFPYFFLTARLYIGCYFQWHRGSLKSSLTVSLTQHTGAF